MGVAVGVTLLVGMLAYSWVFRRVTEPSQAPACFGVDMANYVPGRDPLPLRGARERDGFNPYNRGVGHYADELQRAETNCTPTSCRSDALKAYRSALFWYLSTRLQEMRDLDRRYGEAGLRVARQNYDTPTDRQIEEGLRARYRAGVFRINDVQPNRTGNREAIAILVLKDAASLRPCRKTDVAPD